MEIKSGLLERLRIRRSILFGKSSMIHYCVNWSKAASIELHPVRVRSVANQAVLMQHKSREMLVAQRTQLLNGLRGHLQFRAIPGTQYLIAQACEQG